MRNDEAKIQAEIVWWARDAAPQAVVFAVPNDGWYSKSEAAKRKWIGVLAGVHDVCIIDRDARAYFLEVKQPGKDLSESQASMAARFDGLGVRWAKVTSLPEAQEALAQWGVVDPDKVSGPVDDSRLTAALASGSRV